MIKILTDNKSGFKPNDSAIKQISYQTNLGLIRKLNAIGIISQLICSFKDYARGGEQRTGHTYRYPAHQYPEPD